MRHLSHRRKPTLCEELGVARTFHEQSHRELGPISVSTNEFCSHHCDPLQDGLVARGVVSLAEDRQPWEGSPVRNKLT